ncbi:hypothetical protein FNF27_00164 [Cafeteria roenbergensis]|uniref:ATP-dependent DNA helicase n=1 Tax=Cafeteria roenbergensis TaxID=33653 RepID=A0A5A8ELS6_CAFRO|nr:hypothetical protein FNF27_00164 [Cafeteria roenbergensis]
MLLTGAAGTGKSLTVTRLVQAVRRDARRVVVTASTGIAACAVGGVTLHAFSGVGSAQRPEREIVQSALRNPRTVRRWRAADCLVIEEVSMVDADLLSKVDAVARACRGRDAPMGGVQTVLVGDFHQLPPVSRGGPAFAFESPVWPRLVQHTVVLREVFRQRDSAFVRALNAVRAGAVGAADRALLARCAVPADGKAAAPAGAVVLCPRNDEADAINASRLAGLPGRATSLLASFTESKEGSAGERDSLRRQLERGCLAPEQLQLKVGASVVLLTNLDPARGLVNGTRGVVTGWAEGAAAGPSPRVRFFTGSDIPHLAEALARGSALAARARAAELSGAGSSGGGRGAAKKAAVEAEAEAADRAADAALGDAVEAACSGVQSLLVDLGRERFLVSDGAAAWVARVQFPLRLAWALSIHKSQGMTLDRLWVRCGNIWEAGQAYVALSRARSPEGLTLEGFDPARHVHVHPRVASFYAALGRAPERTPAHWGAQAAANPALALDAAIGDLLGGD